MSMSESTRSKSPRPAPSPVVRPAREVRLIEESGSVAAYPQPHRTPVLPSGWAPLRREHQQAVLCACDAAEECLVFRLGSLWDKDTEYRVYRLANELWGGMSVVTKWTTAAGFGRRGPRNHVLIGLSGDGQRAVKIALDFFNWDLQTHGQTWRLEVVGR
jgi:hypothetical protein